MAQLEKEKKAEERKRAQEEKKKWVDTLGVVGVGVVGKG